jgi:hypothetical protein
MMNLVTTAKTMTTILSLEAILVAAAVSVGASAVTVEAGVGAGVEVEVVAATAIAAEGDSEDASGAVNVGMTGAASGPAHEATEGR